MHSGLTFDNVAHVEESKERKTEKTEEERRTDRQTDRDQASTDR